jgi:hypothetical protein
MAHLVLAVRRVDSLEGDTGMLTCFVTLYIVGALVIILALCRAASRS